MVNGSRINGFHTDDDDRSPSDRGRKRKKEDLTETDSDDEVDERIRSPPRRRRTPSAKAAESAFYSHHTAHVRFSPSVKPGSPQVQRSLRSSEHRRRVSRMRLQNVPSEDEQHEFNIRMRRDMRSRRRLESGGGNAGVEEGADSQQRTRRSTRQRQPMPPATPQSTDEHVSGEILYGMNLEYRVI